MDGLPLMLMEEPPPLGDERRPPHSVEAEQCVLGALWLDNSALPLCSELLAAESFYYHQHRTLFALTVDMIKAGQVADMVTVWAEAERRGCADGLGGLAYLAQIVDGTVSSRNVRGYAEIVAEAYGRRELIKACQAALTESWQDGGKLDEKLDHIAGLMSRADGLRKGIGSRVPLMRLDQLRQAAQRVRWTVKHVIPAASVGMLFGGSGTFKSFIALDAALHVVHGLPWMGRITQQAPVLYIAAEGGAGMWGRIHAWHKARGLRWADVPLYVVPAALDLTQDAWRVVDAAQALGVSPAMVIVDTLSQTYAGEENSANEMAAYLRELGVRFRELWQCSVLLVHHSGHAATERPRGSSAIRANIDFLLGVFRDEKEMLATVSCVKQKDGELFDDATFAMSVVPLGLDDDGDQLTSLVARHLSGKEEVERARLAEQAAGRGGKNSSFMALVQNGMPMQSLRKAFYELLGDSEAEAKKKAFYRCKKWAEEQGLMEIVAGVVIDRRDGAQQ